MGRRVWFHEILSFFLREKRVGDGRTVRDLFGVGSAEEVPSLLDEFAPAGIGHEDDDPLSGVVGFFLVAAAVGDDRRAVLGERHEVEVAYGVDDAEVL